MRKKNKLVARSLLLLCMVSVMLLFFGCAQEPVQEETVPETTEETTLPPPEENVFTPSDFAYEGDYLTCLSQESLLGIDVSTFQKEIDWEQVAASGVSYAMIRAGYRGYSTGNLNIDPYFEVNIH